MAFAIGDDVIPRTDGLLSVQPVQDSVPLHDVPAFGTESPSRDSEGSEELNHLSFGKSGRTSRFLDRLRLILRMIPVLEPLGGFGQSGLLSVAGYSDSPPLLLLGFLFQKLEQSLEQAVLLGLLTTQNTHIVSP